MSKYFQALTNNTIQEVIRLSEDHRQVERAEEAKRPQDQTLGEGLAEMIARGPNQKFLALQHKVESLTNDEKNELMALMRIGRAAAGETPEMWSDLVDDARREDEPGKTAYMTEKPLGFYLRKGLERLEA